MQELAADTPDETRSSFRQELDRDHRGHVRVETELRTYRQRSELVEHLVEVQEQRRHKLGRTCLQG
jgi:hypothetical protein